jgi:hypothetical protein
MASALSEATGPNRSDTGKTPVPPNGPENYEDDANRYDSHTRNALAGFSDQRDFGGGYVGLYRAELPVFSAQFSVLLNSSSQMSWNWTAFFFNYFYFFYRKNVYLLVCFTALFRYELIPSTLNTWNMSMPGVRRKCSASRFPIMRIDGGHGHNAQFFTAPSI